MKNTRIIFAVLLLVILLFISSYYNSFNQLNDKSTEQIKNTILQDPAIKITIVDENALSPAAIRIIVIDKN